MEREFSNFQSIPIDASSPNSITSTVPVPERSFRRHKMRRNSGTGTIDYAAPGSEGNGTSGSSKHQHTEIFGSTPKISGCGKTRTFATEGGRSPQR